MLIDNDWPEEQVDFVNHQLISMLNTSVQVYYKVQIAINRRGMSNQISGFKGQISCFFKSISTPDWVL